MRPIKFRGKAEGTWYVVTPDNHYLWSKFWALADKETIGQFTGLLDSQSKEIYEGDIVKTGGDMRPLPVIFEDGAFQIAGIGYYMNKERVSEWFIEVVGNIYEHPELLPEVKQ